MTSNENLIKCWGNNNRGQLGIGNKNDIGDEPNELGDDMIAVDLGTDVNPLEVSAGGDNTCALLEDTTSNANMTSIKCWGSNIYGQLGIGNITGSNNNIGDDFSDELGDHMKAVDFGTGVKPLGVSVGLDHVCALLQNTTSNRNLTKCWGSNSYGQLGIGNITGSNDQIGDIPGELGDHMEAVDFGKKGSCNPTALPTTNPTALPTTNPTSTPTVQPTPSPTKAPLKIQRKAETLSPQG